MPLFEFTCHHCQAQFEELISSRASEPPVHCPQCGSAEVQKQMSTFASRVGHLTAAGDEPATCPTGTCCLNGSCGL